MLDILKEGVYIINKPTDIWGGCVWLDEMDHLENKCIYLTTHNIVDIKCKRRKCITVEGFLIDVDWLVLSEDFVLAEVVSDKPNVSNLIKEE